jgi:hypothetical protein
MVKHIFFILLLFSLSCSDDDKDEELPVIDMSASASFPQNCGTVYRGESFTFRATFTDNAGLGSFSIEMHNNFDHHTHSTDITDCEMDAVKTPVNPLLFIDEFEIPGNLSSYEATAQINVPDDVDVGDYHFMVRLTDAAGWQALKGISVKIADR